MVVVRARRSSRPYQSNRAPANERYERERLQAINEGFRGGDLDRELERRAHETE